MNLSISQAVSLAQAVVGVSARNPQVEVALAPTFVSLQAVGNEIKGTGVALSAQDVFWKSSGAYTGEVSPEMLNDVGCSYCIVGHSERRGRFGVAEDIPQGFFADTNETVSRKLNALIDAGITPILCVGETADERQSGATDTVLQTQLVESLAGAPDYPLVIAYEPVWAIGTGQTCEAVEAARICARVKEIANRPCRVLYGGSVKSGNAKELFAHSEIDGALVGGASLAAQEFSAIIEAAQ